MTKSDALKQDLPPKSGSSVLTDAIVNILLPSFVLMKLSSPERLGELRAFLLALAIPFVYSIVSAIRERKLNWIAALGLVNILLSGGLRFAQVGRLGFAIKEAVTPAIIGAVVLYSLRTEFPLVRKILYNEKLINVKRIDAALTETGRHRDLERLLLQTTVILASSFFLSAALNFSLAWWLLVSPVGTVEFNQELGKMQALSWPVIVLPCMAVMAFALWHLARGLRSITGLDWEGVLKVEEQAEATKSAEKSERIEKSGGS